MTRWPVGQGGINIKGAVIEIDLRIGVIKVQTGRDLLVLKRQHRFYQTGHPGGRTQMTNISFNRANGTKPFGIGAGGKGLRQPGKFDGVAQFGTSTVRLDIRNGFGMDAVLLINLFFPYPQRLGYLPGCTLLWLRNS